MSLKPATVDFLLDQLAEASGVSPRKMFGEYAIYRGDKLVALVCDDKLFVKPTHAGRTLLGDEIVETAPYPGAKPCLVVLREAWDDAARLVALVEVTAEGLPSPKRSARKAGRRSTRAVR